MLHVALLPLSTPWSAFERGSGVSPCILDMTQPIPTLDNLIGNSKAAIMKNTCATTPTDVGGSSPGGVESPSLWDHSYGGLSSKRALSVASGGMGGRGMAARSGSGGQLMCGVLAGSSFPCSRFLLPQPTAQLRFRSAQTVRQGAVGSYGSIRTPWPWPRVHRSSFPGLMLYAPFY